MTTTAVIQARMGSTRLPGKVMLPLAGDHVLVHVVERVAAAETVDEVVVATSTEKRDDIVARYADRTEASAFRGSESDVLDRVFKAADQFDTDAVVRITADCPLIVPDVIDAVVTRLDADGTDYAANIVDRTFPRGLDVEAFTFDSFKRVHASADEPHHREHVTPYYREQPDEFDISSVVASDVYADEQLLNRTDLRLTLDEADDYELLRAVYEGVAFDDLLPVAEAIEYVDENELRETNAMIEQKEVTDASGDPS